MLERLSSFVQRRPAFVAGALVVVAVAGSLTYWPGLMIWDSARQYDQALSGRFDDWHPPAMEWVWRLWTAVCKGPAPMLLMQLAFYVAGLGLLIRWALQRSERWRAIAIGACALLPISVALMGEVIKDSLMTAILTCAAGLWIGAPEDGGRWRRLGAGALVIAAATLRYNAFLAGAPLLVALAPVPWRDRLVKQAGLALAACAVLFAAMPTANRLLGAQKSGVELSLMIFDMGGIGYHTGKDAFPPLGVADPVAVNRQCYTPEKWDSYALWVDPLCPIRFDLVRAAFAQKRLSPKLWWMGEILAHPIAYAEHRLSHWNINTGFLIHREPGRAVKLHSDPNDGNYQVIETPVLHLVDRLALISSHTPLGWPASWMALALGLVILSPSLPGRRWILPLSLSGLLYGLGYGVFSVATDTRYYMWTMTAAALALAMALTDGIDWRRFDRRRLALAGAPAAVVVSLSILWRLV